MAACSCLAPRSRLQAFKKKSSEIEGDRQLHAAMSPQPAFKAFSPFMRWAAVAALLLSKRDERLHAARPPRRHVHAQQAHGGRHQGRRDERPRVMRRDAEQDGA
jgi:hypothetical protein